MELGEFNKLNILRFRSNGCYLGEYDGDPSEITDDVDPAEDPFGEGILLPQRYVKETMKLGDELTVFVYTDSEDRVVATTQKPKILLHEFAPLMVKSVTAVGAFLDWGLQKDLFVPYAEQAKKLEEGNMNVVFLYLDAETERLVGTTKIDNVVDNEELLVEEQQEVKILVYKETPLGYKAIINDENVGLLYRNELNQRVRIGEYYTAFVKKIREDNKIDLTLDIQGSEIIEPSAKALLIKIQAEHGFVPYNDKSDPEDIREYFKMSKKTFKKAVGSLYKDHLIEIKDDGLYLVVEDIL
ncbi:MAG: putative RNA-binding protein (virulence factor B family) [Salibacteraceae bacterium]|jgi:predicted RNA-binding protein (virulence factor B family)